MHLQFDDTTVLVNLHALDENQLDQLDFGVVAFDQGSVVKRYNLYEIQATGLKRERVIGNPFFTDIAQCMNNYLVAQKYLDASDTGQPLDQTLGFVLTWRMRPTPATLRLLSSPDIPLQYLLLKRAA
jgi:photoactive yellow protein